MAFYCFLPGPDDLHDFRAAPPREDRALHTPHFVPRIPGTHALKANIGGQYLPGLDLAGVSHLSVSLYVPRT